MDTVPGRGAPPPAGAPCPSSLTSLPHGGPRLREPRWTTRLALSLDHRIADGQQGSQLLADIAAVLREPGLALL